MDTENIKKVADSKAMSGNIATALIQAGYKVSQGIANKKAQQLANEKELALRQAEIERVQHREDTAYTRAANDMRNAGLSPAMGVNPASSASVDVPNVDPYLSDGTATDSLGAIGDTLNQQANRELNEQKIENSQRNFYEKLRGDYVTGYTNQAIYDIACEENMTPEEVQQKMATDLDFAQKVYARAKSNENDYNASLDSWNKEYLQQQADHNWEQQQAYIENLKSQMANDKERVKIQQQQVDEMCRNGEVSRDVAKKQLEIQQKESFARVDNMIADLKQKGLDFSMSEEDYKQLQSETQLVLADNAVELSLMDEKKKAKTEEYIMHTIALQKAQFENDHKAITYWSEQIRQDLSAGADVISSVKGLGPFKINTNSRVNSHSESNVTTRNLRPNYQNTRKDWQTQSDGSRVNVTTGEVRPARHPYRNRNNGYNGRKNRQ